MSDKTFDEIYEEFKNEIDNKAKSTLGVECVRKLFNNGLYKETCDICDEMLSVSKAENDHDSSYRILMMVSRSYRYLGKFLHTKEYFLKAEKVASKLDNPFY